MLRTSLLSRKRNDSAIYTNTHTLDFTLYEEIDEVNSRCKFMDGLDS